MVILRVCESVGSEWLGEWWSTCTGHCGEGGGGEYCRVVMLDLIFQISVKLSVR